MTAQHTPGPWKLKLGKGVEYDYIINGGAHLVACFAHYKHFTKKETKANARLIAAAPDLLEALQRLMGGTTTMQDALEANQQARAAIAEATGEKND